MNIFHSNGRIRTDIDPGKILGDRRAAFNALVAAQVACEQAEANEKVANSKVEVKLGPHPQRGGGACPSNNFSRRMETDGGPHGGHIGTAGAGT